MYVRGYLQGSENGRVVTIDTIAVVQRHGQDKSENGLCLLSPPHYRVLKNGDPHYLVLQATSITKFYLTVYYF
jgi:hypothetical protein